MAVWRMAGYTESINWLAESVMALAG